MMKLITLFSALALFVSSASAQLETIWQVDDPTLTYAGGVFTMQTFHGVGINWMHIGAYDLCPNGDASYNGATYNGSPFSYFLQDLDLIINSSLSWTATGTGYTNSWSFELDHTEVGNSALYTENNGVGTISFCMRFGLLDSVDYATFHLVNFKQMLVTITFDLEGEFDEITSFETQAIEEVLGSGEESFTVEAGLCDAQLNNNAEPFNQGQQIALCACVVEPGVTPNGFDSLVLMIDNDPNNALQTVLYQGTPVGNIVDQPDCTVMQNGQKCCQVNFLLLGIFFPVDENQSPATAVVTGNGMMSLSLLRRHLADGRQLEETKNVEFEAEWKIQQYANGDSGAPYWGLAGAAGAAMGAALLL